MTGVLGYARCRFRGEEYQHPEDRGFEEEILTFHGMLNMGFEASFAPPLIARPLEGAR